MVGVRSNPWYCGSENCTDVFYEKDVFLKTSHNWRPTLTDEWRESVYQLEWCRHVAIIKQPFEI